MRRNRRKRTATIILIIVMLGMIAAACAWLLNYGKERSSNAANTDTVLNTVLVSEEAVIGGTALPEKIADDYEAAEHVYSHRGKEGPREHSFKAYDEAIEAGSHYIEQDLVLSADGTLFVSHDLSAYSMTGTDRTYASMTDAEIAGLRTNAGTPILKMEEVFDRYGRSVKYVIELKAYEDSRMADAVKSLLEEYGYEDQVIIQCEDLHYLRTMDEILPDIPKLYVCKSQWGLDTAPTTTYIDIIALPSWLMSAGNVQAVHNSGKLCSAWTLDTEDQIRAAIDYGVDAYFTNETALAISIEKEFGSTVRAD